MVNAQCYNVDCSYLDGIFVVLLGAEEECTIHQRVAVEH